MMAGDNWQEQSAYSQRIYKQTILQQAQTILAHSHVTKNNSDIMKS